MNVKFKKSGVFMFARLASLPYSWVSLWRLNWDTVSTVRILHEENILSCWQNAVEYRVNIMLPFYTSMTGTVTVTLKKLKKKVKNT